MQLQTYAITIKQDRDRKEKKSKKKNNNNNNNNIFKTHTKFFLLATKAKLVVGFRRIQVGDYTGGRLAVLWPIRLQCAGVWISTGLPWIHT